VLLCCGNWHAAFETEDRFVLAIVSVEGDAQQPDFNLWSFSLFTTRNSNTTYYYQIPAEFHWSLSLKTNKKVALIL
jgi:hypothetical protein